MPLTRSSTVALGDWAPVLESLEFPRKRRTSKENEKRVTWKAIQTGNTSSGGLLAVTYKGERTTMTRRALQAKLAAMQAENRPARLRARAASLRSGLGSAKRRWHWNNVTPTKRALAASGKGKGKDLGVRRDWGRDARGRFVKLWL